MGKTLLSVIFSAQSKKAWMALLGTIIGGAATSYLGVDFGNCQEQVTSAVGDGLGNAVVPIITGALTAGPAGALAGIFAWLAKNK